MLIDFTVENYRSIKAPVTLSAVAQKGRIGGARDNGVPRVTADSEIACPHQVEGRNMGLLPALAIYGANASGKSNLARALNTLLLLMRFENDADFSITGRIVPFALDEELSGQPTRFELRLSLGRGIYTYALEINRNYILSEQLSYIPALPKRNVEQWLFRRERQPDNTYHWNNGAAFAGPHTQLQRQMNEHQTYIGLLSSLLNVEIVEDMMYWLKGNAIMSSPGTESFDLHFAARWGHQVHKDHFAACQIVRLFDVGIDDIEIEEVEGQSDIDDRPLYRIWACHQTPTGRKRWSLHEESTGTQRLFSIAQYIVKTLEFGAIMIVDELGSSIHPNVTRHIIRLFQNHATNPKHAQLIFTSHDNTLWRDGLLRRDQIWFTEKQSDGSTALYPLSDFKVRNDLALDRAYLNGRFGAVPILPSEEELVAAIGVEE